MLSVLTRIAFVGSAYLLWLAGAIAETTATAQSYSVSNIGPDGALVTSIAIDPRTPTTAYAGTWGAGPLKTTDGGASWTNSMQIIGVFSIAVDPLNPSTVYAATSSGIQKSVDAGATWAYVNNGLASFAGYESLGIAVDPVNAGVVYAATGWGIYKSADGGANWFPSGSGLVKGLVDSASLAIDPAQPSTLYLAIVIDDYISDRGVFKSVNSGKSWERLRYPPEVAGRPAALAFTAMSKLYVAVDSGQLLASADGGTSWTQTSLPAQDVSALAVDPVSSATIYMGTGSGSVYRSADAGAHWTLVASGLPRVNSVTLAASSPSTVLVGGDTGIYRGADSAGRLARVHLGTRTLPVNAMAFDPGTPSTIYVGSLGKVMKTADGGATWLDSGVGLSGRNVSALVIDPSTPSTLYASVHWPANGSGLGVFKSTDAGASWAATANGLPQMDAPLLAIALSRPTTLYASGRINSVWKSIDGAASWTTVYSGLHDDATAIAVDPVDPETVYLASMSTFSYVSGNPRDQPQECWAPTILKSTNGGAQFRQVWATPSPSSCYLGDIRSFMFDPSTPGVVYALGGALIRSTDNGETWAPFSFPGLDAGIYNFATDPNPPGRILASTGGGLAVGTRGSTAWTYISYAEGQILSVDRTGVFRTAGGLDGLFEYRFSAAQPTTGSFTIDSGISGTWSNPAQPDHVFMLELLPTGQLLAMWFVYAPQAGQSWIFALGSVSGDQATLQGTQSSGSGARFPPNLDTANVQTTPWGTLTFRFSDCNHAHIDWTSTVAGYGSGGMDLMRLTQPAGIACSR